MNFATHQRQVCNENKWLPHYKYLEPEYKGYYTPFLKPLEDNEAAGQRKLPAAPITTETMKAPWCI